jgi:2-methylcitrate dehydratase PrpD
MSASHAMDRLCTFLAKAGLGDLPEEAIRSARRGVLDWLGCVLGGSTTPASALVCELLCSVGGAGVGTVIGRKIKLGLIDAALANGVAAHALDYDDTRGSAPILAAMIALAEQRGQGGTALLVAYAAGIETSERLGEAMLGHHPAGWHPIGTLGTVAAAAAAGKLLGLDAARLARALGIAATQAAGLQRNRGTASKPLNAGKAAANGLLAALLAERGFDCAPDGIEGRLGFGEVYGGLTAPDAITRALGASWAIARNGYKPYPCGLIFHPIIDGVLALRSRVSPAGVASIELRCHPIVAAIGGNAKPESGAAAKFSASHAAAVAFADGRAGLAQFSDERAHAPEIAALRRLVTLSSDELCRMDQATVRIGANEAAIAHALGTPENPMSDTALEVKFVDNAAPIIGADRAQQAVEFVRRLETLDSLAALAALCA